MAKRSRHERVVPESCEPRFAPSCWPAEALGRSTHARRRWLRSPVSQAARQPEVPQDRAHEITFVMRLGVGQEVEDHLAGTQEFLGGG